MRTFDEISADVRRAVDINDAEALLGFAIELDKLGTPEADAKASNARGTAFRLQGDYSASFEHYHSALALYEVLGDRSQTAAVLGNIGIVQSDIGDFPAALDHYHRALAIDQEIGDRKGVARVTGNIGIVHRDTGDYLAALEHFQRALLLHEELGDHSNMARVTSNIGNVYCDTGDYPAALEYFQRALAMHEDQGNRSAEAHVDGNIGNVYLQTGDYIAALEHFHRALAIHEEHGYRQRVAAVTGDIGSVHLHTGDYPAALEHFHRALAIHEELGNRVYVAAIISSIGNVYSCTGDYPTALEHYHRALPIHAELGNRRGVAGVTGDIGTVYVHTGDIPAALGHFRRALALYEELGDRKGVAGFTCNIGSVYIQTSDYPTALEHLYRALALYEELGDRSGLAYATGNIVETLLLNGSSAEAQIALAAMDVLQLDDPIVQVGREHSRATLLERNGDLDRTAATLQRALNEAQEHGLRALAAETHKRLRDLAQKRNDLAAYIEHNNEYARITEEINGKETALKMAMQAKQREIDAERKEHEKQLAVLHSTLPKHIADRVARGETVNDHFDSAAVIFLDIVGFTTISDRIPSGHIVHLLEQIFTTLDRVCAKHGVVKIKTIGDSYMAVAFSNTQNQTPKTEHVVSAGQCAVEMLTALNALEITMPPELGDTAWTKEVGDIQVRIGVHCGPVTAGVIGTERMQYDVWGDTVNVASRMESSGDPGRIHVSEQFAHSMTQCLPDSMTLLKRGTIEVKGKGPMTTYWLEGTT